LFDEASVSNRLGRIEKLGQNRAGHRQQTVADAGDLVRGVQERAEVSAGLVDEETGDNAAGQDKAGKVTSHPDEQLVEPRGAGGLASAAANLGQLAEDMEGEADSPRAAYASAHCGIRGLERVVPVAVAVVDKSGAGNEARLAMGDHQVAMGPEGLGRANGGELYGVGVAEFRMEEGKIVARLDVVRSEERR